MRIVRCDWDRGGWGKGKGEKGTGNLAVAVTREERGEMYGAQPAEQWKTVVQTNDPQRDRYGPHRKDGHKAWFPGNQFPEGTWVLVVNHSAMEGTGNESKRRPWKRRRVEGGTFFGWVGGARRESSFHHKPESKITPQPCPSFPEKQNQWCGCSSLLPLGHLNTWWLHCRLRFRKISSNWFISHRRPPSILIGK